MYKLLRQNISKAQLLGFAFANLIGLTVVLLALQIFFDINPFFTQKDAVFKRDFFVITKQINALDMFKNGSAGFSENEIDELKNARFVKAVGEFTASQFEVYGQVNASNTTFSTDLFFESVPDNFIDVQSGKWHFSPDKNFVPIILPKTYLNLYNFGFAKSRSMPKISQSVAGLASLDLVMIGNGKRQIFTGKIVGFSNRINTILAPQDFILWANRQFAPSKKNEPARLILEINNIADSSIATFFSERGYEVEGENAAVGKMSFFLKLIIGIALAIGFFICLLSFVILMLSIFLLLQKNRQKLQNLRLIGYSKNAIANFYILLASGINLVVYLLSLTLALLIRPLYCSAILEVFSDFSPASILPTCAIGFGVFLLISMLNILIIRRKID
ncbi:MAG: ABC transporter permease [Prevotellaceae bacterium]|jgi:hypothetical protein|nr:ABC transporter permease [Prevotellaceae bacterium]